MRKLFARPTESTTFDRLPEQEGRRAGGAADDAASGRVCISTRSHWNGVAKRLVSSLIVVSMATVAIAAFPPTPAFAQTVYTVTDLGSLFSGGGSTATGIDSSGRVS